MAGEARRAFVPIAGLHHATRERAAGFCVFNDIGVVIETLRAALPDDLAQVCTQVDPVSRRVEGRDVACHYADGPVRRRP